MLEFYAIDTVLDIGANTGQFAQMLRDIGYSNRILSFEPLSSAYEVLKNRAKTDSNWQAFNFGIGDKEDKLEINISKNSKSSSLLSMSAVHLEAEPTAKYIGKEWVEIQKIDTIFSDICEPSENIYMKLDTQGFEMRVLNGAKRSLSFIDTIQMEMSLVQLFEGEPLFNEMYAYMTSEGYSLVEIENGFADGRTGQLLQVDGIFHRL
jgi:FkbM family methyltransferase